MRPRDRLVHPCSRTSLLLPLLAILTLGPLAGASSFQDVDLHDQVMSSTMAAAATSSSSIYTMAVEHSLNGGASFSPRGSLSVFAGSAGGSASFEPGAYLDSDQQRQEVRRQLERLCQADDLYLVRFLVPGSSSSSRTPAPANKALLDQHRSAVHACNMLDSDLDELFTVQLDWRNKIAAITISATPAAAAGATPSSSAVVQSMENGPQPDTAAFIQRLEQEKLAKERGEGKDNRSFLAKYWMYIIPVVLVLVMSSGGDGGGGQQR